MGYKRMSDIKEVDITKFTMYRNAISINNQIRHAYLMFEATPMF